MHVHGHAFQFSVIDKIFRGRLVLGIISTYKQCVKQPRTQVLICAPRDGMHAIVGEII